MGSLGSTRVGSISVLFLAKNSKLWILAGNHRCPETLVGPCMKTVPLSIQLVAEHQARLSLHPKWQPSLRGLRVAHNPPPPHWLLLGDPTHNLVAVGMGE